jgi:acyl-CoA thioester hydrolase
MTKAPKAAPPVRGDFRQFVPVTLRWHDNDAYGHVNNVTYYAFFDTAVNQLLIGAGALDIAASEIIGLVVETRCTYFASLTYPGMVEVGVRVAHIGRSSVRYDLAIFAEGAEMAAARGEFTHVYVERDSQRPCPIPEAHRRVMEGLV